MKTNFMTTRELDIFKLLANNDSTKDIALQLNISEKTVRNHISNVIQKLGVTNRTSAILELIKLNIIKL